MCRAVTIAIVLLSAVVVAVCLIADQPTPDRPLDLLTFGLVLVGIFQFIALVQARTSSETFLRAYVGYDHEYNVKFEWEAEPFPTLEFQIKNWGQTPAFNVRVLSNWKTFDGKETRWPEGEKYDYFPHQGGIFTLNPGSTLIANPDMRPGDKGSFLTTKDDVNPVTKEPTTTYVYGTIQFDDAYGHRRESQFCVRKIGSDGEMQMTNHHNGAT